MKTIITTLIFSLITLLAFSQDLTPFESNEKWGFKDQDNKIIIPNKYDGLKRISSQYFKVNVGGTLNSEQEVEGGKWGLMNISGIEITPIKYDVLIENFTESMIKVGVGDTWGLLDQNGMEVTPVKYSYISDIIEDFFIVITGSIIKEDNPIEEVVEAPINSEIELNITGGQWGVLDGSGKEITTTKYDKIRPFSENRAAVCLNGTWGFIDKKGTVVIPIKYSNAFSFFEGEAEVNLNRDILHIDKYGKILWKTVVTESYAK